MRQYFQPVWRSLTKRLNHVKSGNLGYLANFDSKTALPINVIESELFSTLDLQNGQTVNWRSTMRTARSYDTSACSNKHQSLTYTSALTLTFLGCAGRYLSPTVPVHLKSLNVTTQQFQQLPSDAQYFRPPVDSRDVLCSTGVLYKLNLISAYISNVYYRFTEGRMWFFYSDISPMLT